MKSKGSTDLKTNSNDVTTALQCHASLHRQSWLQGKIHLSDLGMLLVLTALNSSTQHALSLNIDPPTLIPNCKLFLDLSQKSFHTNTHPDLEENHSQTLLLQFFAGGQVGAVFESDEVFSQPSGEGLVVGAAADPVLLLLCHARPRQQEVVRQRPVHQQLHLKPGWKTTMTTTAS